MGNIIELKQATSRIKTITITKNLVGLSFQEIVATITSEVVVTDRLLVSDEAIGVLDLRE